MHELSLSMPEPMLSLSMLILATCSEQCNRLLVLHGGISPSFACSIYVVSLSGGLAAWSHHLTVSFTRRSLSASTLGAETELL